MPRFGVPVVLALIIAGGCSQPTGPEHEISGQVLFSQYCARCHGNDGVPTAAAPTASSLADARIVERLSDESIKGVIRAGKGQMPGFGETFTDATLQVLAAYVRTLPQGGEGGASSPEAAAAQ
ncbi:MAG: cytochrome c [Myxococcota bacterium]